MTLYYTSVDNMITHYPFLEEESNLTSSQIHGFCVDAESEINARLSTIYTVPVTGSPPILNTIATDIAMYRILTRRQMIRDIEESEWPLVFKEARELLNQIVSKEMPLVTTSGDVISAAADDLAESNTMDYNPTFSELDMSESQIDCDKIDDLRSDRGY